MKGKKTNSAEKMKDLEGKRIVTTTFLRTCMDIERAMAVRFLTKFEIRVRALELRRKPRWDAFGRTNLLSCRVKMKHHSEETIGSLPRRKVTEYVNYDDDDTRILEVCNFG